MVRPKVKSSLLLVSQGVGNDAATPSVGLVLASSSQHACAAVFTSSSV